MDQHIMTVEGTGSTRVRPDYLLLSLAGEGADPDYYKALRKSKKRLAKLTDRLVEAGVRPEAITPSEYTVTTSEREMGHRRKKKRQNEYICRFEVQVGLELDMARCLQILDAVYDLIIPTRTMIDFTLKNPAALEEKLRDSAIRDAFKRAAAICRQQHIEKGEIRSIDSASNCHGARSKSHYMPGRDKKMPAAPEDITLEDTVTIVWEVENEALPEIEHTERARIATTPVAGAIPALAGQENAAAPGKALI